MEDTEQKNELLLVHVDVDLVLYCPNEFSDKSFIIHDCITDEITFKDISTTPITNVSQLPDGWNDAIPYGNNSKDDRTCLEILDDIKKVEQNKQDQLEKDKEQSKFQLDV